MYFYVSRFLRIDSSSKSTLGTEQLNIYLITIHKTVCMVAAPFPRYF